MVRRGSTSCGQVESSLEIHALNVSSDRKGRAGISLSVWRLGYGPDDRRVRIRTGAGELALLQIAQTGSGVHPTSCLVVKVKGKAVPLQAWSGQEGSRKLRFPYFMTTAQDGGKVSLTHRAPLPPGNVPGTHFC